MSMWQMSHSDLYGEVWNTDAMRREEMMLDDARKDAPDVIAEARHAQIRASAPSTGGISSRGNFYLKGRGKDGIDEQRSTHSCPGSGWRWANGSGSVWQAAM